MKIVIAGGTGFIGSYLSRRLKEDGNDVLIISRSPGHTQWDVDRIKTAIWSADILINLAGRSINCQHNEKNQEEIISSRISTTKMLSDAVTRCKQPPKLWINSSATAIYDIQQDKQSTEKTFVKANTFLSDVVEKWEHEFFLRSDRRVRKVAIRSSVVFGSEDGALQKLAKITRLGLGGRIGNGRQMFSWIHIEDYFRIIKFIAETENLTGVVNCTAPVPVSNKELMKELRSVLNVKIGIPAPKFAVKLGSKFMDTDADLILRASNVYPETLLKAGYTFKYPTVSLALKQLLLEKKDGETE